MNIGVKSVVTLTLVSGQWLIGTRFRVAGCVNLIQKELLHLQVPCGLRLPVDIDKEKKWLLRSALQ